MDSVALWLDEDYEGNERVRRRIIRDQSDVMSLSDKSFVENFRLNKEAFMYVLSAIAPELRGGQKSTTILAIVKLSAALKVLGQGGYQHQIGQDQHVGLAQQTMSTCLHEVCCAIEKTLCKKHIVFEMTKPEERGKKFFLPEVWHPGNDWSRRWELKHSMNAMVICDHKMVIRAVDARFGEACHDSHVWNISNERQKLKQRFENGDKGTRILGDSGNPLEPWLLTPYRNAVESSPEAIFNERFSKARSIIERVFWYFESKVLVPLSCKRNALCTRKSWAHYERMCALHNICMAFNVEQPTEILNEDDDSSHSTVSAACDTNLSNIARNVRNEIKNAMT